MLISPKAQIAISGFGWKAIFVHAWVFFVERVLTALIALVCLAYILVGLWLAISMVADAIEIILLWGASK